MPYSNHNIEIILDGADTPVPVYAHDTVVWSALADTGENVGSGVTKATVTFTGSEPFTTSLGGTITIEGGNKSSTYTVSTTAKPGNYPYTLVVYSDGQHHYTCEIQVLSDDTIIIDTGE